MTYAGVARPVRVEGVSMRLIAAWIAAPALALAAAPAAAQTDGSTASALGRQGATRAVAVWPGASRGGARDTADDTSSRVPGVADVGFDMAATTQFPLLMGGAATLELPYRLLLRGDVGVLPGPYADAADSILVGAGAYDPGASDLVRDVLGGSLVTRVSGGWRPFPAHGFEVLAGYTLVSMTGEARTRDAIEAAVDVELPATVGTDPLTVDSTVHGIHATLGWRWIVAEHLTLGASLGYLHGVGAASEIEVPASVARIAGAGTTSTATTIAENRLDDMLRRHVRVPVLGASVGYRF